MTMMQKMMAVLLIGAVLSGCASSKQFENIAFGALIGAGMGAAAGSLDSHDSLDTGGAALGGAIIGALAGAILQPEPPVRDMDGTLDYQNYYNERPGYYRIK